MNEPNASRGDKADERAFAHWLTRDVYGGYWVPVGERGAHRPFRIVTVCNRGTKHRHHGISDELDDSAESLDLLGSRRSARAVNPTRSANKTVTIFRSSRGLAARR